MNRDPGLQPERTWLAWRRSMLSVSVVGLLVVRLALSEGVPGALVAAAAGLGWVVVVTASFRHAAHRHDRSAAADPGGPALPLLVLGTVGYAVLGMILILYPLG